MKVRRLAQSSRAIENLLSYSGKLAREKTYTNFTVLESPVKVVSMKLGKQLKVK